MRLLNFVANQVGVTPGFGWRSVGAKNNTPAGLRRRGLENLLACYLPGRRRRVRDDAYDDAYDGRFQGAKGSGTKLAGRDHGRDESG